MNDFVLNMMAIISLLVGVAALLVLSIVAVRHLDEIEEMLSKSSFVVGNKVLYSRVGFIGKIMRICTVSILLAMPQAFARKGLVDMAQLNKFPISMKRLLVAAWYTICISSVIFLGFGTF
ncbi:hypothetical protein ACU5P1_00720 [Pseudomonas plecoglossicida]|uniref:hypothetical protein n=1 Tax=Pseudomonas plecoglossicida TaxID=70775 RepID=UPI000343E868|nr:hypothetical protein [Pseudomonas plecoglossicida]EPB96543.1 hypothetical protein L321_07162 [Pseudomonas plecoglossicida NB2011]QLB53436.1 hypothetical protein HAV28_00720 [Pseudomonas plecoglossicida]